MATREKPSRRFQLALRDLVFIAVACAVGVAILPRFAQVRSFDDQFPLPFSYQLSYCAFALVVVLLSGLSGLILAGRADGHTRSLRLALSLIVGPSLVCLLLCGIFGGFHVHTRAEKAHGILQCLAMGQQAYHIEHREFAPRVGLLAPFLAEPKLVRAEGFPGQPGVTPYAGYVFRVLKAQGPAAPGGRTSYVVIDEDGTEHMIEGFAIIATPVAEGKGITLMISRNEHLVGKALGPDAAEIASQIVEFDPDESWIEVKR